MNNWRRFILRLDNKRIFFLSLILGLVFTICTWSKNYSVRIQNGIANEVIRFHVLANSDANFDQLLKLKVRDEVLKSLYKKLKDVRTRAQTQIVLRDNLLQIKKIARRVVIENGYDYGIKVCMANDMFPTKNYFDVKFPAGNYETLKIIIGEGRGHNWWCVMFPPLCFVDATKKKSLPENLKSELKNILTADEFKIVNSQNEKIPVKIKFKIVEAWQKFNSKNKFQKGVA